MKYLLILCIVLTAAFVSCKKEQQATLPGTWLEKKLVLYTPGANGVLHDTTFLSPFTSFDYIQFNNNGTCVIGGDFNINPPGHPNTIQAITPITENFSYSASGSVYVLTPNPIPTANFAGVYSTDTVSINGNTLLLHNINYGPGGVLSMAYAYYTR